MYYNRKSRLDSIDILGGGAARSGPPLGQNTARASPPTPKRQKTPAPAAPIIEVAFALGMRVIGRRAGCFNTAAHKNGDANPSMILFPDKGRYSCPVCGVWGGAFDLVMKVRGVSFVEARQWIDSRFRQPGTRQVPTVGVGAAAPRPGIVTSGPGARAPGPGVGASDPEVYEALFEICYTIGPRMPAGEYLTGRGLDLELVERHHAVQIGNPDETWQDLNSRFGAERLRAAGLMTRSGAFLFARHLLLFFYSDRERLVYVQGRDITGQRQPKELSLAGVVSPAPYNADLLHTKPERVYLCEGVIDTLSAIQMGYPAVGVTGVTGFRRGWFELFRGVRHVCICFDNDEAGRRRGVELRGEFRSREFRADSFHPKNVKDLNDLLKHRSTAI